MKPLRKEDHRLLIFHKICAPLHYKYLCDGAIIICHIIIAKIMSNLKEIRLDTPVLLNLSLDLFHLE